MTPIPPHLRSTVTMLDKAYPQGIPPGDYAFALHCLYKDMSDRNLAQVMALTHAADYYQA